MVIAMDVGNTNIVLGCFEGERVVFTSRMATDRKKTGAEYAVGLKNLMDMYGISLNAISGSVVSCVVPVLGNVIREALRLLLKKEPLVVGPGVRTGLNILVDDLSSMGSDLVATAVAAAAEYPVPLIVIDLGTATTLLLVNEKKSFIGAVIAPGTAVAASAMAEECDQLPQISLEAPPEVVGKNTVDCMKSGAVYGTAAMLDGLVERMERQIGAKCTLVATGGLASVIVPHCTRKMELDPLLLLKGLHRIYEKNVRR